MDFELFLLGVAGVALGCIIIGISCIIFGIYGIIKKEKK